MLPEFEWWRALGVRFSRSLQGDGISTSDCLLERSGSQTSTRTSGSSLEVNREPGFLSPAPEERPLVENVRPVNAFCVSGTIAGRPIVLFVTAGKAASLPEDGLKWTVSGRTWSE